MADNPKPTVAFIVEPPAPLPSAPGYVSSFYEAIGQFILAWGSMELHLDVLARMMINIEAAASSEMERQFKVNLGAKLDSLKVICRDNPTLKLFESTIRRIAPIIKEMGADRDLLIHSSFLGFDDGPPACIVLRHVEHPHGIAMQVEKDQFSLEQIRAFTTKVQNLHHNLFPMLQAVSELQDS